MRTYINKLLAKFYKWLWSKEHQIEFWKEIEEYALEKQQEIANEMNEEIEIQKELNSKENV